MHRVRAGVGVEAGDHVPAHECCSAVPIFDAILAQHFPGAVHACVASCFAIRRFFSIQRLSLLTASCHGWTGGC